ncbi:MAG: spore coat U domain-containing protein [Hyphomonadaceae bacterium]
MNAGAAFADSATDSFQVTATVLEACEVSADDLEFGDYDPIALAHVDATGSLSITCTNGTDYELGLSLGDGAGASNALRYMERAGGAQLGYTLYQDALRTTLWGADPGTDTLSGVGDGTPDPIDIFGRIPMQQTAPAGAYEDTIVVTVSW